MMEIKHYYIEQGTGFPLILLHGNGEDVSYFAHQLDAFAKHFRVIALDTRGHGKTPRGDAPFTIRQFADDLLTFMDAHGIEKAHILGFSDGGNIAMIFAMKHPERVGKLILDGANLDPSGVKLWIQTQIELGYRMAKLFARKRPEARKNAEMLGLMVHDPDIKPEELSRIRNSTLVVAGNKDMIKEKHTRLIASSIPDAQLAIIPGDHFVANRNPKAFNEVVLRFLLPHRTESKSTLKFDGEMQTERIILRPWLESDAEALFKYASDPEVGSRAGWPPHKSVEESLEIIRTVFKDTTNTWAIVLKETGEAIGAMGYGPSCQCNLPSREGEPLIGYWVGRPYWNQGICTEALRLMLDHIRRTTDINSLISGHFIDNPASGRVMEKCGFVPTGETVVDPEQGKDTPIRVLRLEL